MGSRPPQGHAAAGVYLVTSLNILQFWSSDKCAVVMLFPLAPPFELVSG